MHTYTMISNNIKTTDRRSEHNEIFLYYGACKGVEYTVYMTASEESVVESDVLEAGIAKCKDLRPNCDV